MKGAPDGSYPNGRAGCAALTDGRVGVSPLPHGDDGAHVIWHAVRFDFTGVPDELRARLEGDLRGLASIDAVAWLRLGRDIDQPAVTGLLTAFATTDDLDTYRTHPEHVPVVEALRSAGVAVTRFDVEAPDDVAELPA